MKNLNIKNNRGILLGAGLLAASAFVTSSASAQPAQRRDVREARRDVTGARRDLKDARQDLRREKLQLNRPVFNNGYNGSFLNTNRTIQGSVVNNLDGNDFKLRLNDGQIVRVLVPSGEPQKISQGDIVQAYGNLSAGVFRATSATIVRNR